MKTFFEHLNEKKKKSKDNQEQKVSRFDAAPIWFRSIVDECFSILTTIISMGGFSGDEKVSSSLKDIIKDIEKYGKVDANSISSILGKMKKMTDYIASKNPKSWKDIKGEKIVSGVSYGLSSANDELGNIISSLISESSYLKDDEETKKMLGKAFGNVGEFLDGLSSKVGEFLDNNSAYYGKEDPNEEFKYRIASMLRRIDSLKYYSEQIPEDSTNKKEANRISAEADAIKKVLITRWDLLKDDKELDGERVLKTRGVIKEQSKRLESLENSFYQDFNDSDWLESYKYNIENELEKVKGRIASAEKALDDHWKKVKVLKGIKYNRDAEKDDLDKKGDEEKSGEDDGPLDRTFKKIDIDADLGSMINVEPGKYQADIDKIKDLIGIKN